MISIVPDSNHSGFSDSALPKAWKHQETGNCFLPHYLCLGKLFQAASTPVPCLGATPLPSASNGPGVSGLLPVGMPNDLIGLGP